MMWFYFGGAVILAVAAWKDATTHRIPDALIAALLVCGGLNALWTGHVAGAFLGLLVCGLPALLLAVKLRSGFIGGGDVKLCAAVGLMLGWLNGCLVILGALICLALFGLITRNSERPIPFAPCVFHAYLIVVFLL